MQKTVVNLATDYRLVTDGTRYRIQAKCDDGWQTVKETRSLWFAKLRLKSLRAAEARRRADANAVWETVDA